MSEPLDAACREILSRVSAYLDGDLDEAACAGIVRHCDTCPRCAAIVEGVRATVGLCREAGSKPLPDAVRQRAQTAVRNLLNAELRLRD